MRKQTKLVAVLSAASLLAIGASMTSFAKGWTEENGEWVYLDSDGERVTQEWKKSGSNYYWLDENGVMATSQIVDDDENTYYVNEYGVRAKNQWISVENEDDADVNGEEVDTLWYYFGDNGKAYKAESADMKKKTCPDATGSRTYFFDSEGHMVSGWVDYIEDNKTKTFYCGTENEGWAYTGWQYLEPNDDLSSENYDDLEWFNFKSSGEARKSKTWYSKGRYYTFDENGVMENDWYGIDVASNTNGVATGNNGGENAYTSEDGSKGTGWVYTENAEESDSYWYYLVSFTDVNGTVRNIPFNSQSGDSNWRAKVIKSKTYIFNEKGEMQDGLVKGYLDGDGKTGPIGIFRQIGTTNGDGTNKAKTVLNNITKFSPKGLANVRKTLTNNGKRVVTKLYLICNPADEAEYVDPCMFGEALTGGYVNKTFIDIEKIPDANCPQGKAAFTIDGYYTMGATGVKVTEYDQTKAMENADLIIANCFANGRAVDDNVAVIFDVTKLEEYVINVHQTSTASV